MKKQDILSLLTLFATPVLLMVLGLTLLINPDSASALLSQVLGWCVFLTGVGFGVAAVSRINVSKGWIGLLIASIICLGLGGALVRHPLALASFMGRILGLVLVLYGGRDFFRGSGKTWGLVTAGIGLILLLLPMTTSRLVFSLCGLVMLIVGTLMLLDRLRRRRLDAGEDNDPNIIDAL